MKDVYTIIYDKDDPKKWCVKLVDELWSGIVYSYGAFELKIVKDVPKLSFEIDVLYVPKKFQGKTFDDALEKPFRELLGKILLDIIEKNLDKTRSDGKKLFLELEMNESD